MTNENQTPSTWWGSFSLDSGKSRQWRIGPLTLIVRCLSKEWQIAYERTDDFDTSNVTWEIADTDLLPEALDNNARYIFRETTGLFTLKPLLADRPVISRPYTPFNLPAGEEVTLYVSSPLWVEFAARSSSRRVLNEIAIQRPSDTWFGPSTREGELCYASTTHCRLNLDELPQRPHRAVTPVLIRNQADTTLSLERLNLPAPLLPLYASSNGQLWTPRATLMRDKDGDMAELTIDNKPPKEAKKVVQLSKPRETTNRGALIRAFNTVFG